MFWFNHRRIWYLHQWAMGSTVWLVNCLLLIWSRQASLYQWNGWKGLSSRSSARIKAINIWWRNGWRFHQFLLAQRTTHRTTINELGLPKISHYCWLRPICVAGILCFSVCLRNCSSMYLCALSCSGSKLYEMLRMSCEMRKCVYCHDEYSRCSLCFWFLLFAMEWRYVIFMWQQRNAVFLKQNHSVQRLMCW